MSALGWPRQEHIKFCLLHSELTRVLFQVHISSRDATRIDTSYVNEVPLYISKPSTDDQDLAALPEPINEIRCKQSTFSVMQGRKVNQTMGFASPRPFKCCSLQSRSAGYNTRWFWRTSARKDSSTLICPTCIGSRAPVCVFKRGSITTVDTIYLRYIRGPAVSPSYFAKTDR